MHNKCRHATTVAFQPHHDCTVCATRSLSVGCFAGTAPAKIQVHAWLTYPRFWVMSIRARQPGALTIRSYSDSIRLFLGFVASLRRCKLTRLSLSDLTSDRVLQFLDHLEQERGNCVQSGKTG